MATRISVFDFSLANPFYVGATVTVYVADSSGNPTTTRATLYAGTSGSTTLANPQDLDSYGKFSQPVYVEQSVVCSVSGLSVPDHNTGVIRPPTSDTDIAEILAAAERASALLGGAMMSAQRARASEEAAEAAAASIASEGLILGVQVFL